MAKWRCSDHLSGVWAAELSGHGEVSCGSFISKSENERKTEKLDFKKSGHVRKLPKCSSKNAIMTRINRLNYMMQSHQSEIARLSDENTKLKETLEGLLDDFTVMEGLQFYLPCEVWLSHVVDHETTRRNVCNGRCSSDTYHVSSKCSVSYELIK
ncbi:uncharacterized protein LOC110832810 [Zootermopsis nevadensis]|uniref:uncharacterized protein LOC110832810 n=1 Tax=Zootermopsis nevadensis TaxID=136037 RepID=UPI000B8E3ECB|nr:uncharacterized protein LOC110832810 [Zootermopsis nevadensis]